MIVVLCCALLGGTLGACTSRVAHRLSVPFPGPPRSCCAACARPFPPGLTGWVRAGPACPCRGSLRASPPFGETPGGHRPAPPASVCAVAGAVAAAGLGAAVGPGPDLIAFLAAAAVGVLLAAVDLACLRLPDPVVGVLLAVVAVVLPAAAFVSADPGRLGRAALAGTLCFALHLAFALLPGRPLGPGDVKLAGVLGLLLGWLGWPAVWLGLALPHLLNGPVALYLLITRRAGRRTALPFGPALLTGALLAALCSA